MRPGLVRTSFRTTFNIVRTAAVACCLTGSGCELDASDSAPDDGVPAGATSEDETKAAAGAGGSGANARADSEKSTGGARHDASKDDAGDDSPAGGVGDDTSKHAAGDGASQDDSADEDASAGAVGDDTSKGDVDDDRSAGGAGGDASPHENADDPPDPEQPTESLLCQLTDGGTVPYDYTYGLVQEYALDLSIDCKVGGQLMPLIMEDPDQLSAVMAFESDLVDWYRARVLQCADETSSWSAAQFGLLPPNDAGVSRADVAAAIDLLMAVLDRHDGSADGMTADQKRLVRERLEGIGSGAAVDSDEVTMPLEAPECAPEEDA